MVGSFTLLDVKLEKRIKGSLPIEGCVLASWRYCWAQRIGQE